MEINSVYILTPSSCDSIQENKYNTIVEINACDQLLSRLSALSYFPNLREIRINIPSNPCSLTTLIKQIFAHKEIRHLVIQNWSGKVLSIGPKLCKLLVSYGPTKLHIHKCGLTLDGARIIAKSPTIRNLLLSDTGLDHKIVKYFVANKTIHILDIYRADNNETLNIIHKDNIHKFLKNTSIRVLYGSTQCVTQYSHVFLHNYIMENIGMFQDHAARNQHNRIQRDSIVFSLL